MGGWAIKLTTDDNRGLSTCHPDGKKIGASALSMAVP
jgi:hypothetical protein